MPKKKLIHFAENLTFPFLFQPAYPEITDGFHLKGRWHPSFFRSGNHLTIELGCGKGEYTVALAEKYPERNFIGIDIKGARLWRGCRSVAERNLPNVAFIRTRVDHLKFFFEEGEVNELWIPFPDPQPGKERKRLTSPGFLALYRHVLRRDGIVHLKTDNNDFFKYTLEVLQASNLPVLWSTDDLYTSGCSGDVMETMTYYERLWLVAGKKINYVRFKVNSV